MTPSRILVLAAALGAVAPLSHAAGASRHPALAASEGAIAVPAASVVFVGHPARGAAGRAGHANFQHPALATHRAGQSVHLDPNRYLVLPPASTTWRSSAVEPVAAR